eukprot:3007156-Pleurochrysis_carterae.AAC.1
MRGSSRYSMSWFHSVRTHEPSLRGVTKHACDDAQLNEGARRTAWQPRVTACAAPQHRIIVR